MRKLRTIASAVAAILMMSQVALADNEKKATTFKVDASKSQIAWKAKKVTGEHFGKIPLTEGTITLDKGKLTGGSFVANIGGLTVEDLKDANMNGKLTRHLKNDDFFSTDKFPSSKFVVTNVVAAGGNKYNVTGDLTIKGITKPVTFPVTLAVSGKTATATGLITVDRTKYDIKFRSKSFFDAAALGDNMIYDDFTLEFTAVASL